MKLVCKVCGKAFESAKMRKTCSHACSQYYRNHHEKPLVQKVTKTCPWCGKQFVTYPSGKSTCSTRCYDHVYRYGTPEAFAARKRAQEEARQAKSAKIAAERAARQFRAPGLTPEQMRAVEAAQDGDPAQLYRLSQGWTDKQRKYAKARYMERHGLKEGFCEFSH